MAELRTLVAVLSALTLTGGALAACAEESAPVSRSYALTYEARFDPPTGLAHARITVDQPRDLVRMLDFSAPASRYTGFDGDGDVRVDSGRVFWTPSASGGTLSYSVVIDRISDGVHQARLTNRWTVFRLGHVFPPARARALAGTSATATVALTGPEGWRFETPYGPSSSSTHTVPPDRLFPRPVGWALGGELGIRRDRIAGRRVAVAAPVGQGFRRQDTLAFLRWTLPEVVSLFPGFPERLLIAGSGQDMWRGGLSGPSSLYMHPGRPLGSGNGTSSMLHELMHVGMGSTPSASDDWVVEGLAEYYALALLRRADGISERRFQASLASLDDWVREEDGRLRNPSTGPDTAYAALLMHQLDEELRARGQSLDGVLAALIQRQSFTRDTLAEVLAGYGVELPDGGG